MLSQIVLAQVTIVKGKVTDFKTNQPIPFVIVQLVESNISASTDIDGNYELKTSNLSLESVKVNYLGHKPVIKKITPGKQQTVNFRLAESVNELEEVIVKSKKGRYKNKGNPAVEFIKKVIDKKEQNRPEEYKFYEFEKYEKAQFAISNITENIKNKKILKNYQFIFDNLDSTKLQGKPVLPFYFKETIAEVRFRKSPKTRKEVITGSKSVTYKGYIDEDGIAAYSRYLYQDINIYNNNVILFSNQFLSPIADLAPTFYQYYLADTLEIDSVKCVKLSFRPRNKADFLFQGDMFVTLDSNFAIRKIDMTVNPGINLNWVKELYIRQSFKKQYPKGCLLVKDEIICDFGIELNKSSGLYGERKTSYRNFKINQERPAIDYEGLAIDVRENAKERPDTFWSQSRHDTLTKNEKGIYSTIDSVQKVPSFKKTMQIAMLMFAGYRNFKWFEIGPVSTFYSFNPIEGLRLRFGGRTTPLFSKKLFLETYLAYGFKDEKYKGYLGATYSLSKRTIWQFPVKSLKVSYQYDTKIPGQDLQFVQESSFLLSFKRGVNDKYLYNGTYAFEYLNEFRNHFSYALGFKYVQQEAAGSLHFNPVSYIDRLNDIKYLTTSEASLILRYAPNEIFYQGKTYRSPITTKYPVFTLRLASGIKDLFGGEYEYQKITLNIFKRFYLSQLGFTDVTFEGGKIIGQVPFPLLYIHRANQSYSYQLQSYNLMNFLEFVSDEYEGLNADHNFNGFLFNKVPLFKRLKWRELVTMKILYGTISSQNNPSSEASLYKLPTQDDGSPLTYSLESKPYVEGGVGVGNIFRFLRIDLVKRFSYTHNPRVSEIGIRFKMKFDF